MMRTWNFPALALLSSLWFVSAGCEPEPAEGEGEGEGEEGEGEGEGEEGEGEGEGEIVLSAEAIEMCTYSVAGTLRTTYGALLGMGERCTVDLVPDAAALRTMAAQMCEAGMAADWQIGLEGGRVAFDLADVRACAAEDVALTHGAAALPASCAALTTGSLGAGAACVQHWDCQGGLLCESADLVSPLACLAPAALGEDCASGGGGALRSCGEGLVCQEFECVAAAELFDSCASTNDCADGLRCDTTISPARCIARGDVGDTCAQDSECDEGLGCIASTCALRLAEGAACVDGDDACDGFCSVCRPSSAGGAAHACLDRGALGDGCDDDDDCRAHFLCAVGACAPAANLGAACTSDAGCREGLSCDDTAEVCVATPGAGDACTSGGVQCAEGACVEGTCVVAAAGSACAADSHCDDVNLVCLGASAPGVCGEAPALGASCSLSGACADGAYCNAGSCVRLPAIGEACVYDEGTQDRVCGAGAYCDEAADECVGLLSPGQACTIDDQCESALCANGTCTEVAASCMSNPGFFQLTVLMGVLVPLRLRGRLRRRRAA